MPRRLREKAKYVPDKPKRFGSQSRYRPSKPFLQSSSVKENQEPEAVIGEIGSKGDGIAKLQGFLIFVPRSGIGERVKVRIASVGGEFAIAERVG